MEPARSVSGLNKCSVESTTYGSIVNAKSLPSSKKNAKSFVIASNIGDIDERDKAPCVVKSIEVISGFFERSPDTIKLMLSFLDPTSMEVTAQINRCWNKWTIESAKERQFNLIKNFVEFLSAKLNQDFSSKEIQSPFDILSGQTFLNSENLIQVKLSIILLRQKKMYMLAGIAKGNLIELKEDEDFKKVVKPLFFKEIIDLAIRYQTQVKDYKELETTMIDDKLKKDALCSELIQYKENYNAFAYEIIQFSKRINDVGIRDQVFNICIQSKFMGLDNMIEAMRVMSDSCKDKDKAFWRIIEIFKPNTLLNNNFIDTDKLSKFVNENKMPGMEEKDVLLKISKDLLKERPIDPSEALLAIDNASKVAMKINDLTTKSNALDKIVRVLVNKIVKILAINREFDKTLYPKFHEAIDKALKLAKELPFDKQKSETLTQIRKLFLDDKTCGSYQYKGKALGIPDNIIDELIKIAETIQDNGLRNQVLYPIFDILTGRKDYNKAIEVAEAIKEITLKNKALNVIFDKLTLGEEIYILAVEVSKKIKGDISIEESISKKLLEVSKMLINCKEIDFAVAFAREIRISEDKNQIFGIICECLIKENKIDEALELLIEITDLSTIVEIFKTISTKMKTVDDTIINKIIQFADTIAVKDKKLTIFDIIFMKLDVGKIEKFASLITDEVMKNQILARYKITSSSDESSCESSND